MLLLQAQGALLTGTSGFLEIDKNSRNMTLCLIHRFNLPLTHSLLDRFFKSNFNYIIYLLFSSLIYSLSTILVYHLSDWLISPLRLGYNPLASGNRHWGFHVSLLMCANTPRLVYLKYIRRKGTSQFASVSHSLSYLMISAALQSRYHPIKKMQEQRLWEGTVTYPRSCSRLQNSFQISTLPCTHTFCHSSAMSFSDSGLSNITCSGQ